MIVCASPFFNELDLLEIKLRELSGVVDLFVLVEATTTFTGIPKPLYFRDNAKRFANFPILDVVIEHNPTVTNPWDREWFTQKTILESVRGLEPEIAIWCDLDEIPRRDTVDRFRAMNAKTAHIDMASILYFFDREDVTQRPTTAKIGFFDPRADHQPWRGETHHPVIPDAGWHFQFFRFGGAAHLLDKLNATCHSAEAGSNLHKEATARGETPGLERCQPYQAEKLPAFVRENRARYAGHFFPG
jgi:beta-1,4-mannosyl-glycoprotein beta-1,4-N-acetylglucosaminyltransferase